VSLLVLVELPSKRDLGGSLGGPFDVLFWGCSSIVVGFLGCVA
jgi:hypothetical protein